MCPLQLIQGEDVIIYQCLGWAGFSFKEMECESEKEKESKQGSAFG